MNTPLPDDLSPTTLGQVVRHALRVLNMPPARIVLTLLALLALLLLLGAHPALPVE